MILANMKMDVVTVEAGLLHDVLEDTDTSHEQLQELFGPEVVQLVDGVRKISKIHFASRVKSIRRKIYGNAFWPCI